MSGRAAEREPGPSVERQLAARGDADEPVGGLPARATICVGAGRRAIWPPLTSDNLINGRADICSPRSASARRHVGT